MARAALFVSTSTYADGQLAQLPSAARDAVELGALFGDPRIGPFTVSSLESPSAQEMRLALEDLFSEASPGDTVVLYVSGHGLKDLKGNLYFAAHDTRPNRLQSTAVSAQLLCSLLNDSRAEGVVVFLDCCYGGAFARGMVARAAGDPHVGDAFAALGGGARSRAVITASSAIEYAFEGERLTDSHIEPSVFASAMRDGIAAGEADRDGDGWVGLSELFEYIRGRIQRAGQPQTPQLWTFGASGDLRVTRNPHGPRASVSALPAEIRELLSSPVSAARLGAATDLRDRTLSDDLPMARAAVAALVQLTEDDSLRVRKAAGAALAACTPQVEPASLNARPGETVRARLTGPPVALDALVASPPEGVAALVEDAHLTVNISAALEPGEQQLELRWAGGVVSVPLTVAPAADQPTGSPPAETPPATPTAADAADATATPTPDAGQTAASGPVASSPAEATVPPQAGSAAPAKPARAGAGYAARSVDRPTWLLATAAGWLLSLVLPMYTQTSYIAIRDLPGSVATVMLVSGLVLAGVGLYRLRIADRGSLGAAVVVTVAVQVMAVVAIGDTLNDNEGIGIGTVLMAASVVTGVVYLTRVILRLGLRSPAGDRPLWLVGSGATWLLTLFLPMGHVSTWDQSPFVDQLGSSATGAILLLVPGVGAIGTGLARIGSPWRRRRSAMILAIVLAVALAALAVMLIVATQSYDEPGQAGILAVEPLALAMVYLVDLAVRAIRGRKGRVGPDGIEPPTLAV